MDPDFWIINKVETAWFKVAISPYEVARFFYIGSAFAMSGPLLFNNSKIAIDYLLLATWILLVWMTLHKVKYAESQNSKGYLNPLKSFDWFRTWCVGYTLASAVGLVGDIICHRMNTSEFIFFGYMFTSVANYTSAINWIKPQPKRKEVKIPSNVVPQT